MDQEPPEGAPETIPSSGPNLYRAAWAFYLFLAIVAVVWIGVREQGIGVTLLWSEGLGGFALVRSLVIDVALGLASAAVIIGGWELAERRIPAAAEVGAQLREMLAGLTSTEALGLALLSGVGEELFFRGAVQGSFSGWGGWLGATALFAALHGGPGKHFRWWSLFAGVAGGIMGAWFLLRGNLTAPITAHVAVNGFQLLRAARGRPESPSSD